MSLPIHAFDSPVTRRGYGRGRAISEPSMQARIYTAPMGAYGAPQYADPTLVSLSTGRHESLLRQANREVSTDPCRTAVRTIHGGGPRSPNDTTGHVASSSEVSAPSFAPWPEASPRAALAPMPNNPSPHAPRPSLLIPACSCVQRLSDANSAEAAVASEDDSA